MPDPYQVLGVSPAASDGDVRAAYLWLAKKFHPDINSGDERALEWFQEIERAYSRIQAERARSASIPPDATSSSQKPPPSGPRQAGWHAPQEGKAFRILVLSIVGAIAIGTALKALNDQAWRDSERWEASQAWLDRNKEAMDRRAAEEAEAERKRLADLWTVQHPPDWKGWVRMRIENFTWVPSKRYGESCAFCQKDVRIDVTVDNVSPYDIEGATMDVSFVDPFGKHLMTRRFVWDVDTVKANKSQHTSWAIRGEPLALGFNNEGDIPQAFRDASRWHYSVNVVRVALTDGRVFADP
jgi:hypothetical protein